MYRPKFYLFGRAMEKQRHTTASSRHFYTHLLRNTSISLTSIVIALFIGMLGYHELANLPWVDSFLNASMILGGMGPVDVLCNDAAKLFAGFYALFSGLAFIVIVAIMFSPMIHKVLRKIHLEDKSEE